MKCICTYCGNEFEACSSAYNRAVKHGLNVYCSREHSGLGRRKNKSKEQKKADKAEYDRQYRAKNIEMLKKKKHEYFTKTYDPAKAAIERKKRMPKHVEYCRRPEYRAYKKQYDKKYRANKIFGEYADAFLVLLDIEEQIDKRELRQKSEHGYIINKSQIRKRSWKSSQRTI